MVWLHATQNLAEEDSSSLQIIHNMLVICLLFLLDRLIIGRMRSALSTYSVCAILVSLQHGTHVALMLFV